ncbi:MAG: methyl-accepting chemotaxis protein [Lachnospiraceae bacterium]|nr:methyl-accepting chemotaxis protein [Lachnospiraceae bacterium]
MKRKIKTQKRQKKGGILQTITFQNTAINTAMLLAFLIVMLFTINSISNMEKTAVSATTNVSEVLKKEAIIKESVIAIDGDTRTIATILMMVKGSNVSLYRDDITAKQADIKEALDFLNTSILVSQLPDGKEQVEVLDKALKTYYGAINNVIGKASTSGAKATTDYIENDYAASYAEIQTQFDTIEGKIQDLVDSMSDYLDQSRNQAIIRSGIGMIAFMFLIALSFILQKVRVSNKISSIVKDVNGIIKGINEGKGDLTARVNTKTSTELSVVVSGINHFIETLQSVIRDVKDGSVVLTNSSEAMTQKIQIASDNISNTSAALEEIAASMDTVANVAEDMTGQLAEVKTAADDIREEAHEGSNEAERIRKEAEDIKQEALSKKNDTGAHMEELSKVLEVSVKDSEQVSKIAGLTNDILEIAEQTNLLALNASIEAARAGEAGKGFAVVAGEISSLAANSRETANHIQEISKQVTEAVNSLSKNAVEVMDFINDTVLGDYDAFVDTGEKYGNTAHTVANMLDKFTQKADNLNVIMDEMANSVDSISASVHESSDAISLSANNSTEIVEQIQGLEESMDENSTVTNQLTESTKKFETL